MAGPTTERAPRLPAGEPIDWTPRQRQVLDMLVQGRTNPEIAEVLGVTLDGAKYHLREILARLGVDTREEAADYWRRHNGLRPRLARRWAMLAGAFASRTARFAVAGGAMVAMAVVAVVLVAALRDGDDSSAAEPAATVEPSPSPTATPTPSPAAPTPEPGAANVPPQPGDVVYVVELGMEQTGTRGYPLHEARTWPGGGRLSFEPWALEYVHDFELYGDRLVVATESAVRLHSFDDSDPEVLYEKRADEAISDISLSHDGQLLAVLVHPIPAAAAGTVVFIDPATGVVARVAANAELAAERGYFWQSSWLADGSGIVVNYGTQSEMPGSRAIVRLDGSQEVLPVEGFQAIDPTGRFLAGGAQAHFPASGCDMLIMTAQLVVTDLITGDRRVVAGPVDGVGYRSWEWVLLPNREPSLIFETFPTDSGDCTPNLGGWEWLPSSGLVEPVSGPDSAKVELRGFSIACSDGTTGPPRLTRAGELHAQCANYYQPGVTGELLYGGAVIDTDAVNLRWLGTIPTQ